MADFYSQLQRRFRSSSCPAVLAIIVLGSPSLVLGEPVTAVERAIIYLAREVPKWHRENRCYSCHNNGDAVRALATAASQGQLSERKPLDDTLDFLRSPDKWDANGPDGPFKDEKLARIQFTAALADATTSGLIDDRGPLESAAELLVELQHADGSWPADAEGTLGSPVTYGQALATAMGIRILLATDGKEFAKHVELAQQWFSERQPRSVLDAAATLLALSNTDNQVGRLRRIQALKLIAAGESDGGGWGPFVSSPPDVFDTRNRRSTLTSPSLRTRSPAAETT
jgi:hypothetical protein